jgi:hypothetical protein
MSCARTSGTASPTKRPPDMATILGAILLAAFIAIVGGIALC